MYDELCLVWSVQKTFFVFEVEGKIPLIGDLVIPEKTSSFDYMFLVRFKRPLCISLFLLGSTVGLTAQTIPLGMPFFDDGLRRAQLMGRVDTSSSFMIRPVHPQKTLKTNATWDAKKVLFPNDSNVYGKYTSLTDRKQNYRIEFLPVYLHFRRNGHHPYGWSDGPMVPSKGLQRYISGGVFIKLRWIEAQLRPELVQAQNKPFQNPPFRAIMIDLPERMGQDEYKKSFWGQSYAKLHVGPFSAGYSTENIWWGPGQKNAIIMSNNAPGFGHYTLNTNRPVKTVYGTIEGQMVCGQLKPSGFTYPLRYTAGTWPPIAGDVVVNKKAPEFHSYINGMMAVFQPKWTPGLSLGASRVVQVSGTPASKLDYLRILYLSPGGEQTGSGPDSGRINRNQLVSLSFRYMMPESHAEFYAEIGREDWFWDFEDLMTRPFATTAWLAGFRKLQALKRDDEWLEIMGEVTKIQAPMDNYIQANSTKGYSFYTNGNRVGWTNQGQVIGAGIGPGSNMYTAGVRYLRGFKTWGFHVERVAYNEDLYYGTIDYLFLGGTNPYFKDISKHFVDWGFLISRHTNYGKLFVGYNLHVLKTYNFQWNYSPDAKQGDFRFPGINVWSLNLEVSTVYRF